MAAPVLWILGAMVAGGAVLLARGADHEQASSSSGGGGGEPPYMPPTNPAPAPDLSCADALNIVGATPGAASLAATISLALAKGTDPAALEALALQLETAAGSSSTTPEQRAALVRLAQCCRDRATALRVAKSLEAGTGASLSSSSTGYAAPPAATTPPAFTAAPPPELAAPAPPPQPTAVVVDSYAAARSSPLFTAARMGGFY